MTARRPVRILEALCRLIQFRSEVAILCVLFAGFGVGAAVRRFAGISSGPAATFASPATRAADVTETGPTPAPQVPPADSKHR